MFFIGSFEFGAEDVVAFFTTSEADHLELGREVTACGDVVEGRDEFAMGEITRGAEDDDGAGFSTVLLDEGFLEGVFHESFSIWGF